MPLPTTSSLPAVFSGMWGGNRDVIIVYLIMQFDIAYNKLIQSKSES